MVSEKELIETYLLPLSQNDPAALNFADDTALLSPTPGHDLVISKDLLIEGVHFLGTEAPHLIAHKALAVNLSDIAAKTARPRGFFAGFSFPSPPSDIWLENFADGFRRLIERYDCPLLGGDVTGAKAGMAISITILGEVKAGRMVRLSGAKPGDLLYVTGTLGDAALGLRLAREPALAKQWNLPASEVEDLINHYQRPEPRLQLTPALKACANAAMDISDGVMNDLDRMSKSAGLGANVELTNIPLSKAFQSAVSSDRGLISLALGWGDDYEILSAIPPNKAATFEQLANEVELEVSCIGKMRQEPGEVTLVDDQGRPIDLKPDRFEHF